MKMLRVFLNSLINLFIWRNVSSFKLTCVGSIDNETLLNNNQYELVTALVICFL